MAGFGKCDGVVHGFAVTYLAHQNHIGRLAQGVFQGHFPVLCVHANFALRHDAVFVRMHKFNGVFHCDDVTKTVFIAPIQHGRHAGGFARTSSTHNDAQAAFRHGHVFEYAGQTQAVDGRYRGRNGSQHHTHIALLNKSADAKTSNACRRNGEIAFLGVLKFRNLFVVHDRTRQCQGVPGCQGLL